VLDNVDDYILKKQCFPRANKEKRKESETGLIAEGAICSLVKEGRG
jgi:hypothetical protein